jgi:hypothetical protein
LLGWLTAAVGALITLIGFVAGLVGYFSVKSKAQAEAREAAKYGLMKMLWRKS